MFQGDEIFVIREKLGITRKEFSDALQLPLGGEKKLKDWETGVDEVPEHIYQQIVGFSTEPPLKNVPRKDSKFTIVNLFAGVGGIRQAFQRHGGYTVLSSEWDKFAQKTYRINFGETPHGDITQVDEKNIPEHNVLLGGFPCQPFSHAGLRKGFEGTRGTLFFDTARILREKQPQAFMLENVKQLRTHDKGRTLQTILVVLKELGYYTPEPQILNAKNFGVPQNRERIILAGFHKDYLPEDYEPFTYPSGKPSTVTKVGDVLECSVPERYTLSDKLWDGHMARKKAHGEKGNGFGFSLFNENSTHTNTISARYYKDGSEALIEQKGGNPRMLTPRECARLQGFPEEFIIPVSNAQAYKQFGNSVCIPVISAVAEQMVAYMEKYHII